jgi:hypothetical protein
VPDAAAGLQRVKTGGGGTDAADGTVKSGGQIAKLEVGNPTTTGFTYLYVPDSSRASAAVVRYKINSGGSLAGNVVYNVPNVSNVGGGLPGGGRAVAAAVDPRTGDLYVGYLKSGDIVKVNAADAGAVNPNNPFSPVTSVVGSTTDGRGVNGLAFFDNGAVTGPVLYLAELGGFGLSAIIDPSGTTRAACTAGSVCNAATVPNVSFFPGGIATDDIYVYVADSPFTTSASVLQYNPALADGTPGRVTTLSTLINPTYSATLPCQAAKTYTQYFGALGLSLDAAGNLYVGDDPTASFVVPASCPTALPTTLGHIWKIAAPASSPSLISMNPASGPDTGNTTVTFVGPLLGANGNKATVTFGSANAASVTIAPGGKTNQIAAVTPKLLGGGIVPVTVTVTTSTGTVFTFNAGDFTFTAGATGTTPPTVTAISPGLGLPAGGTLVTITGTGFTNVNRVIFGVAGNATRVTCSSSTTCVATSPASVAGNIVDIHGHQCRYQRHRFG